MIDVQKKLLSDLLGLRAGVTANKLAQELGIERTRFFRILNGHELKLSEYLAIRRIVCGGVKNNYLEELDQLGGNFKKELGKLIERAKLAKKLFENPDTFKVA